MNSEPLLEPLPQSNRRNIFVTMIILFVVLVPILVFYATGYRVDFDDPLTNFKVVGGMYITASVEDVNINVDDEPVRDMRVFQNAAYIQNLLEGNHEVYTEKDGVYTWVKKLPVYSYLVTEANSFNMPITPQVRVVTQWLDPATNAGVLFEPATSTPFAFASTSNPLFATTSKATSTYVENAEYIYLENLFASTTVEMEELRRLSSLTAKDRFTFDRTKVPASTTTSTTTIQSDDSLLYEKDGEVYVDWVGGNKDVTHYYCVNYYGATSTIEDYGEHVYSQLHEQLASTTDFSLLPESGEQLCRHTIRIDRLNQTVKSFYFLPNNSNLVLLNLDNGVYVVEIDDRSWQNTQLLYPGDDLTLIVNGGQIFISQGGYYLELFTEEIAP